MREGSAGESGAQDRAGQMHGHASGDEMAVVVWTDDGCPFACAGAVVALVLARLAS